MLEKIIEFITPGPLSEKFEFRMRVLTSWISLGLALGIIMSIAMSLDASNSNIKAPNGQLVLILQVISSVTIMYCLSGFMGMGVSMMRGEDAEYSGWYWWLLPTVGFLVTGFYLAMFILGFIFTLFGASSPAPSISQRRQPKFNTKQLRREVQAMKVEDLLKEFGKQFEEIENKNQLAPEEKKIVKKLRGLDRAALRSQLQDALSDDELEIIFMILIKLLSGELG